MGKDAEMKDAVPEKKKEEEPEPAKPKKFGFDGECATVLCVLVAC